MARIFGSDGNLGLNQINNSTFNVLAMVIADGIGYSYARNAQLDGLSDLLVEKETIDRAEFVAFLKGEPCPEKKEENVLREPEQV